MKLSRDDIPFDLGAQLRSDIPDIAELRQRIGKGEAVADSRLRASTAYTFAQAGRQLLGNLAVQQGFDVRVPDDMRRIRSAIVEPIANIVDLERIADLAQPFIDEISETALAAGMAVIEAIPIIRAVAKIIFTYSGLVKRALRNARSYGRHPVVLAEPTTFSRAADQDVYNFIILRAVNNTRDWTGIFSPPGLGLRSGARTEQFGIEDIRSDGYAGARYGVRILASDATQEPTWLGSLPGSGADGDPFLHEGWQFERSGMMDTGTFYPTARNAAPGVWQMVSNPNTPAMFTVDAQTVIHRWQAYLRNAWEWTRDTKNARMTPPIRRDLKGFLSSRFKLSETATEYGAPKADVTRIAAGLLRRQESALKNPVACAYVDRSYAAIAGNDWHRSLWAKGREKLLQQPALASRVDLSMVPDPEYRVELARRRGPVTFAAVTDGPAGGGGGGGNGGGGGAAGVLLAGAAAALYLWRRKRR